MRLPTSASLALQQRFHPEDKRPPRLTAPALERDKIFQAGAHRRIAGCTHGRLRALNGSARCLRHLCAARTRGQRAMRDETRSASTSSAALDTTLPDFAGAGTAALRLSLTRSGQRWVQGNEDVELLSALLRVDR